MTFPRPVLAFLRRSFPAIGPRRLQGLRWTFLDTAVSSGSGSFYEDWFLLFALAAGVTADRIGFLASAAGLASMVAFLPGAFLSARLRTRKPFIILTSGGIGRLAILGLAFLPTIPAAGAGVMWAILAMRCTTSFMGSFATPAGTTLAGDVVPAPIRGRYFAARNFAGILVAAAASAAAGALVRGLNARDGILGFRVTFVVAFALGMAATAFFSRIPEPPAHRTPGPARRARDVLTIARRSPGFAWLAVSAALWGLAINVSAPFFNVYLVTQLGGTAAVVGTGAAVYQLTGLAGLLFFGRMADRSSSRRVAIVTGVLLAGLPAAWFLVSSPWQSLLINAPAGVLWAGYNLASYNVLLEMSPPEDREAGIAVYQTLVAISAVVGPLLGQWLLAAIGYVPLFALGGAGRLVATAVFVLLARPRRTRGAFSR